jgi:hypothetical protein
VLAITAVVELLEERGLLPQAWCSIESRSYGMRCKQSGNVQ